MGWEDTQAYPYDEDYEIREEEYVESIVRTNRLRCSECSEKINKGDNVIFELNEIGKMENVFCVKCRVNFEHYIDDTHPFDLDG